MHKFSRQNWMHDHDRLHDDANDHDHQVDVGARPGQTRRHRAGQARPPGKLGRCALSEAGDPHFDEGDQDQDNDGDGEDQNEQDNFVHDQGKKEQ